jgi:ribonuclease D
MERARNLVTDGALLAKLVETVQQEERIGLDTESNGFHAYFEKVCLVQVATSAADWVIDLIAVDLKPLIPLLADPRREIILHAAEYDVLCMKRDYGLTFGRIFDTHAAAKVLGIERVGLHNLLEDELGIKTTIDEQKSDWGRRPLSPQQLEYAFADVQFLFALRDGIAAKLAAKGLEREAQAEFARLTAKEPRVREFDPEAWQRMKAARTLDGRGRAVLRELFLLRDRRARDLNRPPFKVLSDLFLSEVARRLPKTEEELLRVPGVSAGGLKRVADGVLEAVRQGLSSEPLAKPKAAGAPNGRWRKGGPGAPPPEVEERFERLRAWRKTRAEARKVEVQVIAPNAVLMAVARIAPDSLPALGAVEGMDPFRLEQYGAEMLAVLRAPPSKPPAPQQGELL